MVLDKTETLKCHLDQSVKKNINEARIKTKVGTVRLVSVYVPSTVKEKKLFLQQLTLALDMIGGDEELVIGSDFSIWRRIWSQASIGSQQKDASRLTTHAASSRGEADEKLMREMVEIKRCEKLRQHLYQRHLKRKVQRKTRSNLHHPETKSIQAKLQTFIQVHLFNTSPDSTVYLNIHSGDRQNRYTRSQRHQPQIGRFLFKSHSEAKTLSHYLIVLGDNNNSNNNEVFGKVTTNSPTALLNTNETYANLQKRAKNYFYSQLITSIREVDNGTVHTTTTDIASVFTTYNSNLFTNETKDHQQHQTQRQQQHIYWSSTPSLDTTQQETVSRDITLTKVEKALKQRLASNPD
ncbi:unnamed protein product [Ambrosiozyma monospora]|uniref:Unnamed protein product n=1 Tax=Ambrosiozyma monospora TaxID=43982 RepID=A0A9W6YNI6_AMBMO|nr:unnamed protein product [Ambrosiozyma monospora]